MIVRHVPRGTEGDYAGARYEVAGSLPAILAKRQANRGIESMAVSPDERFLYFVMQNPLANPDAAAYRQARNSRLFKIERATMKVAGEYVYTLDDPKSFRRDPSDAQSDPRISEMMAVGLDRLIVLERSEQTTKLHEVELTGATDIAGSKWDDAATRPTLEQSEVAAIGITPLKKTLRFDSADFPEHRRQDRRHGAAWATAASPSSTTTTSALRAGGRRSSWCGAPASRGDSGRPAAGSRMTCTPPFPPSSCADAALCSEIRPPGRRRAKPRADDPTPDLGRGRDSAAVLLLRVRLQRPGAGLPAQRDHRRGSLARLSRSSGC